MQLISLISSQRQSSNAPIASMDYLAGHQIENAMADAAPQAFLPVRERDLFNLGSQPTVLRELNPDIKGPLFPDFYLEQQSLSPL